MVRPVRIAFVLAAAALVALLASGCTELKPGSLQAAQTGAGGSVHVHFEACSIGVDVESDKTVPCGTLPQETKEKAPEVIGGVEERPLLAFAIPVGSSAPSTITAVGIGPAPTFTYARSAEVGATFAKVEREEGDSRPWPPVGTEVVGYVAPAMPTLLEEWKWNVAADFGLPVPADGGAFGGPFTIEEADGAQFSGEVKISPEGSVDIPSRPVDCQEEAMEATLCEIHEGVAAPVSDLKLGAPATVTAFPGGRAAVSFPAAYASSATPPAPFALTATTGVPKGTAAATTPTLSAAVDSATHRAAPTAAGVNVAVPKGAKPGSYPVTLTATGPGGRTVIQAGTVTVKSAKPKLGVVHQLRKKGTVLVSVGVPGAGTLTVSGKGLITVKKKVGKAKTLKVTLKAKGPTAAALATVGKASVKPRFKFKPANGAAVTVPFPTILKLGR